VHRCGGTTTVYVYALGNDIAEYDNGAAVTAPSREYIYSGPTLVSTLSAGTTNYELWDQLSVRMTTNSSGSVVGQQGHFPFGEPWYSANTTSEFLFTSYQHDSETGLDYAMARYYDSRMGRFCSPDPAEGWPGDPQSWNRYAYSRNDPVNLTDPSGQSWLAKLLEAIALVVIDTYFPPALAFEADGGIADTMLLNTALAADMRMTQIKNYGFPEETQNPQTAQKPVYCDPGIMAAMLAAYNMGQTMTNAKGSRWEGGFPAYQGSGGTYSAGNGPANKSAEIQTGPATGFSINYRQGAVAIFHTHPGSSSTSGWPSTPSNNAGEGASGDTGAAIAKQTDIYVISNSGLAKAPANGPKDPTYDNKNNSPYIVQGKDIGDWMKTLKTKCNGPQ
jgi:RHS repeat-associated protein